MSPKDVDKLFREALSEGQGTPRPEAWARVAANLLEAEQKAQQKAQPKRRTLWWPYAAAASVAIAAVSTWWIQDSRPEAASNQQSASNQQPATSNQQLEARSQQALCPTVNSSFFRLLRVRAKPRCRADSWPDCPC